MPAAVIIPMLRPKKPGPSTAPSRMPPVYRRLHHAKRDPDHHPVDRAEQQAPDRQVALDIEPQVKRRVERGENNAHHGVNDQPNPVGHSRNWHHHRARHLQQVHLHLAGHHHPSHVNWNQHDGTSDQACVNRCRRRDALSNKSDSASNVPVPTSKGNTIGVGGPGVPGKHPVARLEQDGAD